MSCARLRQHHFNVFQTNAAVFGQAGRAIIVAYVTGVVRGRRRVTTMIYFPGMVRCCGANAVRACRSDAKCRGV